MVQEQRGSAIQGPCKLIFLVEDDTSMEELLVLALSDETPYQVLAVHTGLEALETVKDIKPHLFLLDYLLSGMSGLELYDRLHALDHVADTPTIIFSSNVPTKEVEKRHITGFSKPFELDELLSTIEMLLA